MKINTISPYKYINTTKIQKSNFVDSSVTKNDNNRDFCSIYSFGNSKSILNSSIFSDFIRINESIKESKQKKIFEDFLCKNGKVSTSEYKQICKKYPFILEKANDFLVGHSFANIIPETMAKFAINVKNYFDNCEQLKGKKYKIISIGTSPATLTEALQNLGCDVVFVPLSGVRFCKREEDAFELYNFRLAMDYAKSKCVDDDKNTKYIVLDYTHSGKTLNAVASYISQGNFIASKENVLKMSLDTLTKNVLLHQKVPLAIPFSQEEVDSFIENYEDDLYSSDFSPLSNVPHFEISDINNLNEKSYVSSSNKSNEEIFTEFDNFSKRLGRAYSLCTIDRMTYWNKVKDNLNENKFWF